MSRCRRASLGLLLAACACGSLRVDDGRCSAGVTIDPSVQFARVRAMAFDGEGRLLVLDRGGGALPSALHVFTPGPNHALLRSLKDPLLTAGQAFAQSPDGARLWVINFDPSVLGSRGEVLIFEGSARTGRFPLNDTGFGIAFTQEQKLWVSDFQLQERGLDGAEGAVVTLGRTWLPYQLARGAGSQLWVADLYNRQLHRFDTQTRVRQRSVGGVGTLPGQFDREGTGADRYGPTSVAVDRDGNLYANDPLNSRVQKLDPDGLALGEYRFGTSTDVGAVALDSRTGRLYVYRGAEIDVRCPL